MKQVAFAEVKDHLSKYLIEAGTEQIVITKHGKPAGVLTGFASEDDWFDFRPPAVYVAFRAESEA